MGFYFNFESILVTCERSPEHPFFWICWSNLFLRLLEQLEKLEIQKTDKHENKVTLKKGISLLELIKLWAILFRPLPWAPASWTIWTLESACSGVRPTRSPLRRFEAFFLCSIFVKNYYFKLFNFQVYTKTHREKFRWAIDMIMNDDEVFHF